MSQANLKPPFEWAVVQSLYAEPLFSEAAVRELFMAVGPPPDAAEQVERVTFRLQELGKSFAFDRWHEVQPSVSEKEALAKRLAAACGHVLDLVGAGDAEPSPDNLLPVLGAGGLFAGASIRGEPSGLAATMNALRAVYLLKADAEAVAEHARKRKAMKAPTPGRPQERAVRLLVSGLSHLYFDVWQAIPAVSRAKASAVNDHTGGEVVGPFVRLMVAVADALRARGVKFSATPEALAKHWERLPADERFRFRH